MNVLVIGSGGRARMLITQTPRAGEIITICDVDLTRCHLAIKEKAPDSLAWEVTQD